MKIGELKVEEILDSRNERTIQATVTTEGGIFIGSAPSGKSKGKYEAPAYRGSLQDDMEKINIRMEEILELDFKIFGDLIKLELLMRRDIGANSLLALEYAILKAMAAEQGKQVWQLINEEASVMPIPIVNMIGGGSHTKEKIKPDFQEFQIIPSKESIVENKKVIDEIYNIINSKLRWKEWKLFPGKNDEGAYDTKMANMEVLVFLSQFGEKKGLDVASSEFYKDEHYLYGNPIRILQREDQIKSMINTVKNNNLFYLEDPVEQEDFSGFVEIMKSTAGTGCMIVGDDLIATHPERLKKAINMNAISGVIVKPNQSGSLLEVKKFVEIAKHNGIKTIMSHRSGETDDYILADLAFGFQTDYIKISLGKGRETKWERLIGIERSLHGEAQEILEGAPEIIEEGEKKAETAEEEVPKERRMKSLEMREMQKNPDRRKEVISEMKTKARQSVYVDKEKKDKNLAQLGFDKQKYGAKGISRPDLEKDKNKFRYGFEKK